MRPNQWKRFWKLKIPHGARNFWWRVFLCKLPTRLNLRHINDEPPLCQLCQHDIEDDYHMVFDCRRKKSFWLVARNIAHIKVPMEDIWDILNFRTTTDERTMLRNGDILMVIWRSGPR
ncbi:hypothetical protein [Absidia glauca]|uniref:Reverse transcriptase zinc-binding domain-containing protein n=1 Tax=Absidia glauca TaxID=4829 RepID=A0A163LYJ1_ABSGL|nr:hypothetical protein [Absidia glauca]